MAGCGEVDRREFAPRDAYKRNEHEKGHQGFNIADLQGVNSLYGDFKHSMNCGE